jgi:Xaa-Pro aminopeptidase
MQRREFLTAAGAVWATTVGRKDGRTEGHPVPSLGPSVPVQPQEPSLSPAVFAHRIERAQAELKTHQWDVLIATPSTSYRYFTGYNPGRSERLIALILPGTGDPAIVCPGFEVDRIKAQTAIPNVRGWEERANPYALVKQVVRAARARGAGTVALEASTAFDTYLGLKDALDAGDAALEPDTVVLIDCGCQVQGYTSDITRTVWFGDRPSAEFETVYNLVYDAQTAAVDWGSRSIPSARRWTGPLAG